MKITYDKEVDAKYIYLQPEIAPGSVKRTEQISEGVHVDYSAGGTVLGVEILDATDNNGAILVFGNEVIYLPVVFTESENDAQMETAAPVLEGLLSVPA